ncbi:hypothetical protein [Chthonobacter albigriseus]|uniref:hypothetical protein n=1 Tax=Chthonobacter albigriseus TaxID=1683161 RepID=UPI0015EEF93A|nr:hypothetical protein [Chthonobacter albigriseus]
MIEETPPDNGEFIAAVIVEHSAGTVTEPCCASAPDGDEDVWLAVLPQKAVAFGDEADIRLRRSEPEGQQRNLVEEGAILPENPGKDRSGKPGLGTPVITVRLASPQAAGLKGRNELAIADFLLQIFPMRRFAQVGHRKPYQLDRRSMFLSRWLYCLTSTMAAIGLAACARYPDEHDEHSQAGIRHSGIIQYFASPPNPDAEQQWKPDFFFPAERAFP